MNIIFDGMKCLPSLIGVLQTHRPNFKSMSQIQNGDYSCIKFFTPLRRLKLIKDQPLRLWFADDKEQVIFKNDEVFLKNQNGDIINKFSELYYVLLDLKEVTAKLTDEMSFPFLIKDFEIMTPHDIDIPPNSCMNITDSHSNSTTPIENKSSCVIS